MKTLIISLAVCLPALVSAEPLPELLQEPKVAAQQKLLGNPDAAKRSRLVRIDEAVLDIGAELPLRVHVKLFEDRQVVVRFERREVRSPVSHSWFGVVESDPTSQVVATVHTGLCRLNFICLGPNCWTRPTGDGHHLVCELDVEKNSKICSRCDSTEGALGAVVAEDPGFEPDAPDGAEDAGRVARGRAPRSNTTAQVDVMVVYTAAARVAAGGSAAMENQVRQAVDVTNGVFVGSGTSTNLRLVYSGEVAYTEVDNDTDLTRLRNSTDGHMDEVHQLRNFFGADLVALLTTTTGGIAYLPSSFTNASSLGFSVNGWETSTTRLVLAHELGHNFGAGHDKAQASQPGPGWTPYAAGMVVCNPGPDVFCYQSVMAYQDDCPFIGCVDRLPYFTNPGIEIDFGTLLGTAPIGIADDRDNARAIRESRLLVAAYRPELPQRVWVDASNTAGPQDGLTPFSAVTTLAAAQAVAGTIAGNVEICVRPGTYAGAVTLSSSMAVTTWPDGTSGFGANPGEAAIGG